jgi:hypothetical protein
MGEAFESGDWSELVRAARTVGAVVLALAPFNGCPAAAVETKSKSAKTPAR